MLSRVHRFKEPYLRVSCEYTGFFGLVECIKISATRKKLISVPSLINMGCTHNKSHE